MKSMTADELKKISDQLRKLQEDMEHMTTLEAAQVGIRILQIRREMKEKQGKKEE